MIASSYYMLCIVKSILCLLICEVDSVIISHILVRKLSQWSDQITYQGKKSTYPGSRDAGI